MKKLREHSRAEVASCCPLFFSFLLSFLFCFFPSPAKAPLAIHVILLLLLFLVDVGTLGEERTITAARLSGGESEGANGNADESAIVPQSLPRCRCRRSLALSRSPLFICFFFTVRLSPRPASTHSDYSHWFIVQSTNKNWTIPCLFSIDLLDSHQFINDWNRVRNKQVQRFVR